MALIFPELVPQDRAALCRVLAYEARRGVDATTGSARDYWVSVERQWETLASKVDLDAVAELEDSQTQALLSASRLMA
jgi:hypothetical protein